METDDQRVKRVSAEAKNILDNYTQYTSTPDGLIGVVTLKACVLASQVATQEQTGDIFWLVEQTVASLQKPSVLH